jgi:hypothetical protein
VNGKFNHEDTPEGRLAAIVVMVASKMEDNFLKTGAGPSKPDVADLREILRPFVQREIIHARLDEATQSLDQKAERRAHLIRQFYIYEAQIPKELRKELSL